MRVPIGVNENEPVSFRGNQITLEKIAFGLRQRISQRGLSDVSEVNVERLIDSLAGDIEVSVRGYLYGNKVSETKDEKTETRKETLLIERVPLTWWDFAKNTFVEWCWRIENRLLRKSKPLANLFGFVAEKCRTANHRDISHAVTHNTYHYTTINRHHVAPWSSISKDGKALSENQYRFNSAMTLSFLQGDGKEIEDKVLIRYQMLEEFITDLEQIRLGKGRTTYDADKSIEMYHRYHRFIHESERLTNGF